MNTSATFLLFFLVHALALSQVSPADSRESRDNPHARAFYERMRLRDPATGKIPKSIREKELLFAATLPAKESLTGVKLYNGKRVKTVPALAWSPRGPSNVGGRTRAIAIDVADSNVILAGGVSGGMWRSSDGGGSWTKVTGNSDLQSVTCIAQDTRAGHTNVWYYGTGEAKYNTASAGDGSPMNAFFAGDGIFKSTNNGVSWTQLASTRSATPQTLDQFDLTYSIVTDPSDEIQDVVYAATFGGIQRSTDGGATWITVLGDSGFDFSYSVYSDLAITSTGVVYAVLSQATPWTLFGIDSSSNSRGVYRSTDGITWTGILPAGWPSTYHRVVMDIAPSNEDVVYFLGDTPGTGLHIVYAGRDDWTSFLKYSFLSGDGSGAGGIWENRTGNLPAAGTGGGFANQQSHDLTVKVKPDDENVVFIGGVNMFRSTDGFATTAHTSWIGGWSTSGHFVYANHGADQHAMVFSRTDPLMMLSGNDWGIYKTKNNLKTTVEWTPLNNGYLTGQFYTVAVDHATTNDNTIVGGAQDNGTHFANTSNAVTPWVKIHGGDGAYCAIADGKTSYYTSRQNGVVYRRILDNDGNESAWTRVDPTGGSGYLFVNPFVLDPNNNNSMYLAGGTSLWRNSNLTGIPLLSNNTTGVNWSHLTNTTIGSGTITSLGVSTSPANRLYYGTSVGTLFRLDGANSGNPVPTDFTGVNFPAGAYVSCIAVDPSDADHAIAVFSNYSAVSLFLTADGGASWSDISGNLEQNPDGSGDGPSCRWATILPGGGYFVGTSTGLYSTAELNGASTIWAQEGSANIGNVVVDMMDARLSDGLIVAATHGNGIYSAFGVVGPPLAPVLSSPPDEAVHQQLALKLTWNRVISAMSYDVQVSMDSSFAITILEDSALSDTSHNIEGLDLSSNYHWRVRAKNGNGVSAWSEVWNFTTGETIQQPLVENGWNMISIPLTTAEYRSSVLFPTAVSNAFAYEGGYLPQDTLANGVGYWLKFNGGQSIQMTGAFRTVDTIDVDSGWNLIGSLSSPIVVSAITSDPEGITTSQFFAYKGRYVTVDSIHPGYGYWVKAAAGGTLILSSSQAAQKSHPIRIVSTSEMPPNPPSRVTVAEGRTTGIPKQFVLEQNYPNPFNPVTVIRYQLPANSYVLLKLYNMLGQEVGVLVDREESAGAYEVEFVADNISSGVYCYKLAAHPIDDMTAASFIETKKLVLMK